MIKGNLLIVDDEVLLRKQLKLMLSEVSETILTAENGQEALEVIKNNTIHCIVCDLNMPKMNGADLLKEIRKSGQDIPFILYTGHGSHEQMIEAAKYDVLDFLNKPYLEGLEEIVIRGLKIGTKSSDSADEGSFVSEYRRQFKQPVR